ncbi:hypothetical protein [Mesorhizobium sp. SP-1A]|uniref:hypothetical protein n=1 Tax=Mesorhizobium sp. SP-1A TaxID=3077840 RepID=UPI0028F715BC|nr:hypothetical protein [Mesorhizobium sp. SP-1A]
MPLSEKQAFPDWAKDLVDAGLEGTERSHRVAVLTCIANVARSGAWKEIDSVLTDVPISALAESSLVTLLRGTYRFKEKLAGWDGFRTRVAAELHARKADTARLMFGI